MPISGYAGKSKREIEVTVGDKGRTYKYKDTGEELDDASFKEKEGDYTSKGGSEAVIASGRRETRSTSGVVAQEAVAKDSSKTQIGKADLGAAARANAKPAPAPTPEEKEKKKKNQVSALKGGGGYYG